MDLELPATIGESILASKLTLDRLRTPHLIPMTAYDKTGELNLAPMRTLTQRVFEAGMRVFIPGAGSAEFQSLSAEEILATVEMTKEWLATKLSFYAQSGSNCAGRSTWVAMR